MIVRPAVPSDAALLAAHLNERIAVAFDSAECHCAGAAFQRLADDTQRLAAAREDLARIAREPAGFVAEQVDREGRGAPVVLPDGSTVPRLPGYRRWMWDGEFCGAPALRFRIALVQRRRRT